MLSLGTFGCVLIYNTSTNILFNIHCLLRTSYQTLQPGAQMLSLHNISYTFRFNLTAITVKADTVSHNLFLTRQDVLMLIDYTDEPYSFKNQMHSDITHLSTVTNTHQQYNANTFHHKQFPSSLNMVSKN
jgi:hypothetical protein